MKVLQVNSLYRYGSTGKITRDLHVALMNNEIESIVCYGRGLKVKEENIYKVCGELYSKLNNLLSRFTGVMYGGCYLSTRKLINIIKKEQPDIVHLQCINGYFVNIYKLVEWLKVNNIKTVVTLHAEFMYTGGCAHANECNQWQDITGCGNKQHCPIWKTETKSIFFDRTNCMWNNMNKAFLGFDDNLVIASVSPWLKDRAEKSVIFKNKKHKVVYNGLDTSVFHCYETKDLKKKLGLSDEILIFHATPYFCLEKNHAKGGYYLNEVAKKLFNKGIKAKIIVAGNYDNVQNISENIILLGNIDDQQYLAKLYSMSDMTLLTSKKETYSMVTAESLCCGTPVVGFKAGAPEQIAIKEYSLFVEFGDVSSLESAVIDMSSRCYNKKDIEKKACLEYSKEKMCERYTDIYYELNSL